MTTKQLLLLSFSLFLCLAESYCQEIAITFDDAPTASSFSQAGSSRTTALINKLNQLNVTSTFFVITGNIDSIGQERLNDYIKAGHSIANHTHLHQSIQKSGTKKYLQDITDAHQILKKQNGYKLWFRYPFLEEGRTRNIRDSIRHHLQSLGLSNGYVTVDNYDWYLNKLYNDALAQGKKVNMQALKEVYLDHIINSINFYNDIAIQVLKRSPKHVLLLHENDLASLFINDLIQALRSKGWKIISPDEAYQDAIAQHIPDVLFNGQGRIAAIAYEKGIPVRNLIQESEDEEFLDNLVKLKNVFYEAE